MSPKGNSVNGNAEANAEDAAPSALALEPVLKEVSKLNLLNDRCPVVDLFDLDYFESRIAQLQEAFPEERFIHAAALKANSIRGILQVARDRGLGAECASISEVKHALNLGFPKEKIIFDSPCKTKYDLSQALAWGVTINLDNDYEAAAVDQLLKGDCANSTSRVGLRINPVVGGGSIAIISTATKLSKFGVPIMSETKERVMKLYADYPWLTGIHVHVGSQGVPIDLFVRGVKVVMDLVKEIESANGRKLEWLDIGGGLSTSYTDDDEPENYTYALYRQKLEQAVPDLFSADSAYRVVTEFGRSLFLKAGKTIVRVEHIKRWVPGVKPIALCHVGTNQFIRESYLPDVWRHRFWAAAADGRVKRQRADVVYDLAGPMCFQGDYLAKDVTLPELKDGDWLIIHDTGAYGMAMYSKFNSILPAAVYAHRGAAAASAASSVKLVCLKERETPDETLAFWGLEEPKAVN